MDVSGKTIVITGASRGIGCEISRKLARNGANLIGVARSAERLAQWADEMKAFGGNVDAIAFDLAQPEKLPHLKTEIQRCARRFGDNQIDVLINNAGIEIYSAFADYELEDIERVIQINLTSVMSLTRTLLPLLSSQGHIVNMASLAAKKAHPFDSVYAASKAGLLMWNHSLRQELSGKGLGVSAICPGYVRDTGMLADTGVSAPWLAGRSHSNTVANAVLSAIRHRRSEVIVNQDPITEAVTRGLLAIEQIFPWMNDVSNRWLGITKLNQSRANQNRIKA